MRKKTQNRLGFGVISVIVTLFVILGIVVYYTSLLTNLQESSCKTIEEVLLQERRFFKKTMELDIAALKGFAALLAITDDEKSVVESLDTITKNTDFEFITLAAPNGSTINNEGVKSNIGDRDYFRNALMGATVVSEPTRSKLRDVNIIAIATPIIKGDDIIGVLVGTFGVEKLNNMFSTTFDGLGYTYIATNSGEIIAKTNSAYAMKETGNLFNTFKDLDFYKNDTYQLMKKNLLLGIGGHSQYIINGQDRLMHYGKLDINDWNIFVALNPDGINSIADRVLQNTIILTSSLIIIFAVLLIGNIFLQRRFTQKLESMAFVDPVTGCRSFGKFKLDVIDLINNNRDMQYIMVKLDITDFRLFNEIHSLSTGNKLLQALSDSISSSIDNELDAYCRIYADEFALFISCSTEYDYFRKKKLFDDELALRCREFSDAKLVLPKGRYTLQADDTEFEKIYENVNFAHRAAKNGDIKEVYFDGKVKELAVREHEIEYRMEAALAAGEFHMFLQPKYRLKDEKMVGAEALIRWIEASGGMVYPNEFIPLFERNGFIAKIDFFMFEEACKTIKCWIDSGISPIAISVNFSRRHLNNEHFVSHLVKIAVKYHIPHSLLEIELTETAMLENITVLEDVLDQLHDAGFTLSMDDFGTGYSSLGLLKNIPVDVIKIDKAFFDATRDLNRTKTVITSVMEMARKLKISTVAEGVETQENIDLLREAGCEIVQGYYYAKPMPLDQLEAKLIRENFR